MSRFVVAADVMGIPTTQVPVPLLSDLAKFFPADEIVVTYHHATNHVMVKFPGWDAPAVQRLLDELSVETDPAFQGYVTWPGLHGAADGAPAEDAERAGKSNRFIESDFVERDTKETGASRHVRCSGGNTGSDGRDDREPAGQVIPAGVRF